MKSKSKIFLFVLSMLFTQVLFASELIDAIDAGDSDTVEALLNDGVDPNNEFDEGESTRGYKTNALYHAIKKGRSNIMETFLANGNVDLAASMQKDGGGFAVLTHAVRCALDKARETYSPESDLSIIKQLLENGADPTQKDHWKGGYTPLYWVMPGCSDIAVDLSALLLKYGADPYDGEGKEFGGEIESYTPFNRLVSTMHNGEWKNCLELVKLFAKKNPDLTKKHLMPGGSLFSLFEISEKSGPNGACGMIIDPNELQYCEAFVELLRKGAEVTDHSEL